MNRDERQRQFESRIDEHRKILYKVCRLYCADLNDREDLGQEILVQLWRSYPRFDGRCLFSTWMYRVALNTAISFLRGETSRKRHVDPGGSLLLEFAQTPETETDEVRTMYQLIANMDPLNRALIFLYLDGNSYEEIGTILGISVTNVATKLNRIRNTMKKDAA
jgi:RNA polymerase sigma factor (sigma-70 family)